MKTLFLLWLGYESQTTGLKLTTPSKSAFLTGFSVILVPIFLAVGWRRHINRWVFGGVVTALLGLYLMTVPAAPNGPAPAGFAWLGGLQSYNKGDLLTVGWAPAGAVGVVSYEISGDQLVGRWAMVGDTRAGSETLTRR